MNSAFWTIWYSLSQNIRIKIYTETERPWHVDTRQKRMFKEKMVKYTVINQETIPEYLPCFQRGMAQVLPLCLSIRFSSMCLSNHFLNTYISPPKKETSSLFNCPQFLRKSNFDLLFSFPSSNLSFFYVEEQNYIQYSICKWNRFLCGVRILFSIWFTVLFLAIPNIFSSLQFHRIIFSMP